MIAFLSGSPRQGRIGVGAAAIVAARNAPPAADASLELSDVDDAFVQVASLSGAGSARTRAEALRQLFERATERRAGLPRTAAVRRAAAGGARRRAGGGGRACVGHPAADRAARRDARGSAGARRPRGARRRRSRADALVVRPFTPIQPMLADSADGVGARDRGSRRRVARVQARWRPHPGAQGGRRGSRVLAQPARRHASLSLKSSKRCERSTSRAIVLDGEAIALRARRHAASVPGHDAPVRPQARRRRAAPDAAGRSRSSSIACTSTAIRSSTSRSARRLDLLARHVPETVLVPRIVTADAGEAAAFLDRAHRRRARRRDGEGAGRPLRRRPPGQPRG